MARDVGRIHSQKKKIKKKRNHKVFVLIPAHNEECYIARVVNSIRQIGIKNILVVDDGSGDKTVEVATKAGAEVLKHLINRGQGAALRTGISYLRESYNPDIIVTFDADGQHRAEDIKTVLEPIYLDEADIVLGSRFINRDSGVPTIRKIILKSGIIFTRIISQVSLTDVHNGFRALGRNAIEKISINSRGMEHASEIIDEIKRHKLRYKEVPVKIIYSDYSLGKGQKSSSFWKIGIKLIIRKIA